MKPTESPKLPHRRRANPWMRRILLFVGCVILLDSLVGERGMAETRRARQQYARATAEVESLRHQNAMLRAEMHRLEADPSAIEAVARQELGLVRAGEILVVVNDVQ